MLNEDWEELDQYEQQRIEYQKKQVLTNRIKDLEVAVDFLRGINSDLLRENHLLHTHNAESQEIIDNYRDLFRAR